MSGDHNLYQKKKGNKKGLFDDVPLVNPDRDKAWEAFIKRKDVKAMMKHKSETVDANVQGVAFLLKKNKVDVIWGEAKITKPGEVSIGKSTKPAVEPQHPVPKGAAGAGTYSAKYIIIATGNDGQYQRLCVAAGVPDAAIRTLSFVVQPDYAYVNGEQRFRGYQASNSIEIRLDDVATVATVIDGCVGCGLCGENAHRTCGVWTTLSSPSTAMTPK